MLKTEEDLLTDPFARLTLPSFKNPFASDGDGGVKPPAPKPPAPKQAAPKQAAEGGRLSIFNLDEVSATTRMR